MTFSSNNYIFVKFLLLFFSHNLFLNQFFSQLMIWKLVIRNVSWWKWAQTQSLISEDFRYPLSLSLSIVVELRAFLTTQHMAHGSIPHAHTLVLLMSFCIYSYNLITQYSYARYIVLLRCCVQFVSINVLFLTFFLSFFLSIRKMHQ